MTDLPLKFPAPVTLAGGGVLTREMLDEARHHAPHLVAADGAADRLRDLRLTPDAVIGDMDSLADIAALPVGTRVIHLAEQESTDFEKCLYATEAPYYLAAGFTGRRTDHMLAVFHGMLRYPEKPVILIGEAEVMALVPPGLALRVMLWPGAIVSLFPLKPASGIISKGLAWDISGWEMAVGERIGTSNQALSGPVTLGFDRPGVLVSLERRALAPLIAGLMGKRQDVKIRGV